MALMKWEPWAGLTTLQREMNRLFEAFVDDDGRHIGEQMTAPAVEISDTPEAVIVKAQVPGINKDQYPGDGHRRHPDFERGEQGRRGEEGENVLSARVPVWGLHTDSAAPRSGAG